MQSHSHFKTVLEINRSSLMKPKISSSKTAKNMTTAFTLKGKAPRQKMSENLQSSKIKHFLLNEGVRPSNFRKHSDTASNKFDINHIDALVHKYHKSNLKQTFIMNESKKVRCKTDIVDIIKGDLLRKKSQLSTNSLFDEEDKSQMIIFDKKNIEEIENTETSIYNDTLSFDNSIISYNDNDRTMDENEIAPLPLYSPQELLKCK